MGEENKPGVVDELGKRVTTLETIYRIEQLRENVKIDRRRRETRAYHFERKTNGTWTVARMELHQRPDGAGAWVADREEDTGHADFDAAVAHVRLLELDAERGRRYDITSRDMRDPVGEEIP
jgi:hypothetical protein